MVDIGIIVLWLCIVEVLSWIGTWVLDGKQKEARTVGEFGLIEQRATETLNWDDIELGWDSYFCGFMKEENKLIDFHLHFLEYPSGSHLSHDFPIHIDSLISWANIIPEHVSSILMFMSAVPVSVCFVIGVCSFCLAFLSVYLLCLMCF